MNLVVVTKQFGNYTGATVSTIQLLKKIAKNFVNVTVLTLRSDGTTIENVDVVIVNGYLKLIKQLKKTAEEQKPLGYSDDHLGFIFAFFGIKYIHTYHGNWPDARYLNASMYLKSYYFIPLYKLTIKHASLVVNVSYYMKNKFVDKLNSNNVVIYNGVKQSQGKKSSSCKENNKFLMVGNVDKRKYGNALKVFDILQTLSFHGTIDIYGNLVDKEIVSRLNTYSFVKLYGSVDNINYSEYSALICTSASENLPVSIVESLINNIPVIAFNVGGIPEVVKDKENGYIFKKNNFKDFAYKIVKFKYPSDTNKSAEKILKRFSWDHASQKYLSFFEQLKMENK